MSEARTLFLIPLFPLLGAAILGILGATLQRRFGKRAVSAIAVGVMAAASAVAVYNFCFRLLPQPEEARGLGDHVFAMIRVGALKVDMAFSMDQLGGVMALVVTLIGTAIHVYSTGYMHDEPSYWRYFAYLNLFCFAMLLLVLSDNFILMFFGWEGVGLCSYLLIGFWYTDVAKARAGMKAFVVNRVGDWGFVSGLLILFWGLYSAGLEPTVVFRELREQIARPELRDALLGQHFLGAGLVTVACIGFFVGAMGKSAQIPLYVWLPDAMAGPTPVSALIHAATMVTAGVYMVARLNFLFALSPVAMTVVASVGALTALFAATIGFFQYDIKKVLAYSTVSQLGYMFIGVGVGAYWAGIYHLFTHAFFKACLFLGSGSVIHGMHWVHHRHGHGPSDPRGARRAPDPADPQDMRNMGGLATLMPSTRWTYLIACLAIAGIPGLSGFFSKDAILYAAFTNPHTLVPGPLLWAIGWIGAGCTAFYMFRSYYMTFRFREPSDEHKKHVHESPRAMTWVLWFLAGGAVLASVLGLPRHPAFAAWLAPVTEVAERVLGPETHHLGLEVGLALLSVGIAVAGILLARFFYADGAREARRDALRARWDRIHRVLFDKYYVDEAYQATAIRGTLSLSRGLGWFDLHVVDWAVNAMATLGRGLARAGGLIDLYIVDGLVNLVADSTLQAGRKVRRVQTGRINNYAYVVVAGAVALLFVTYLVTP
jgi:NADH-quinone oxidoreductase subunit L